MPPESLPIPWRRNLVLAATALAINAGCLWWASHTEQWWQILIAAAIFSFSNHTIFVLGHEAVHGILLPWRRANEVAGSLLAATFPQAFTLQRAYHLSHHRNNRTDSEFFDGLRSGENRVLKYWQWYGILIGEYWLRVPIGAMLWLCCPWVLRSAFMTDASQNRVRSFGGHTLLEHLDRVPPWRSRMEILWAIAAQVLLFWLVDGSLLAWALCYGAFAINWGSLQYTAHAFSERDIRDGAYDLRVWLPLRSILLNYHLHLAHHRFPQAPWTALPALVDHTRPRPHFLAQYIAMWRGIRPAWGESPSPEPLETESSAATG